MEFQGNVKMTERKENPYSRKKEKKRRGPVLSYNRKKENPAAGTSWKKGTRENHNPLMWGEKESLAGL